MSKRSDGPRPAAPTVRYPFTCWQPTDCLEVDYHRAYIEEGGVELCQRPVGDRVALLDGSWAEVSVQRAWCAPCPSEDESEDTYFSVQLDMHGAALSYETTCETHGYTFPAHVEVLHADDAQLDALLDLMVEARQMVRQAQQETARLRHAG